MNDCPTFPELVGGGAECEYELHDSRVNTEETYSVNLWSICILYVNANISELSSIQYGHNVLSLLVIVTILGAILHFSKIIIYTFSAQRLLTASFIDASENLSQIL